MKEIKKLISIGANCISTDIINSLGIREPSPVDNIAGFNIWKSHVLFDGEFKQLLFKNPYQIIDSTEYQKKQYFFLDKIYKFKRGFYIVHNDFESKKFQKSIKKRIRDFKKYYKKSIQNDSFWFVYSLNADDNNLTEEYFNQILPSLPDVCKNRLICFGMRGHNELFAKYFTYYLDCGNEEDYTWHSKDNALKFILELESKYNLHFNLPKEVR